MGLVPRAGRLLGRVLAAGAIGIVLLCMIPAPAPHRDTLRSDSRSWLQAHARAVISHAGKFQVRAVAVGAVVCAEIDRRTVSDDWEEDYVHTLLAEKDDAFFRDLQHVFQQDVAPGPRISPLHALLYFWSLGRGQVQVRLALELEKDVAAAEGRPPRGLRGVLQALLDDEGCLDYVAASLSRSEKAFWQIAGVDISEDVGLLATLYNMGSPEYRAQLALRNSGKGLPFRKNEMGLHAEALAFQVESILRGAVPGWKEETGSGLQWREVPPEGREENPPDSPR